VGPGELAQLLPVGSLETSAPSDVGVTTYVKGESIIVQMVNYGYDYQEHAFTNHMDIDVSVRLPPGFDPVGECVITSPDADAETLDCVREGEWIRLRVPSLKGYTVIRIS